MLEVEDMKRLCISLTMIGLTMLACGSSGERELPATVEAEYVCPDCAAVPCECGE